MKLKKLFVTMGLGFVLGFPQFVVLAQEPIPPVYAGTGGTGTGAGEVYRLNENGSWQLQLSFDTPEGRDVRIQDFGHFRGRLYASTHSNSGNIFAKGLYYTVDGVRWVWDGALNPELIDSLRLSPIRDRLYAPDLGGLHELRQSFFGGFFWNFRNFSDANMDEVVDFGGRLYAASHGGGLYSSLDDGQSWAKVAGFPSDGNIWTIAATTGKLYLATYTGEFYQSSNGTTWTLIPGFTAGTGCAVIVAFGQQIIALAGERCELFQSSDGNSWQKLDPGIGPIQVLYVDERSGVQRIYAGISQSVRYSDDLLTWTPLPPLPRGRVTAITVRALP
ncbi:MAG: hypothetical protein HY650_12660 [Acidobacteria bacterium]|nr:hypothetical protein [Acidobacteriota bacterium]